MVRIWGFLGAVLLLAFGCTQQSNTNGTGGKLKVTTTTSMVTDLDRKIFAVAEGVPYDRLLKAGADPLTHGKMTPKAMGWED